MGSVLLYALAALLVVAGLLIAVLPVVTRQPHTDVQIVAGTAMVALGALFGAPASSEKAAEIIKPLLPWGRRGEGER